MSHGNLSLYKEQNNQNKAGEINSCDKMMDVLREVDRKKDRNL